MLTALIISILVIPIAFGVGVTKGRLDEASRQRWARAEELKRVAPDYFWREAML